MSDKIDSQEAQELIKQLVSELAQKWYEKYPKKEYGSSWKYFLFNAVTWD